MASLPFFLRHRSGTDLKVATAGARRVTSDSDAKGGAGGCGLLSGHSSCTIVSVSVSPGPPSPSPAPPAPPVTVGTGIQQRVWLCETPKCSGSVSCLRKKRRGQATPHRATVPRKTSLGTTLSSTASTRAGFAF